MVAESTESPSAPAAEPGAKRNPSRRRRSRRRRTRTREAAPATVTLVDGHLHRREDGKALFLPRNGGGVSRSEGVPLDPSFAASCGIEGGVAVVARVQGGNGQGRASVIGFETIEGLEPEAYRERATPFNELTCIDPLSRFSLETEPELLEPRVVELVAPIGKGQRCLIVAPPKAGKTVLLQQLARAIATNHPEAHIFVLLVDERPEEVTDWQRNLLRGEVWASSTDKSIENHIETSEIVLERARRLVELGEDVVIFNDSLTRMSRAYNNVQKGSGRILSGGIDARTMAKPRRFFGSARNIEGGGSLTIIATCLVDTGSRMDEVIFQEFKGTGNTEIILSHDLFERRIFPCINISGSGTRKEEKLYAPEEVEKIYLLRRALAALPTHEAMLALLARLKQIGSNSSFLASIQAPNGR